VEIFDYRNVLFVKFVKWQAIGCNVRNPHIYKPLYINICGKPLKGGDRTSPRLKVC
jgi:hypothetical protein